MKKLRYSLGAKMGIGILAFLCMIAVLVSGFGLYFACDEGWYDEGVSAYEDTMFFRDNAMAVGYSVADARVNRSDDMVLEDFNSRYYNNWYIRMKLEDTQGEVVYSNCEDLAAYGTDIHSLPLSVAYVEERVDSWGQIYYEEAEGKSPANFTLYYCFDEHGDGLDRESYHRFQLLFPLRYLCIGIFGGSAVLGMALTILLCCMLGYKKDHEGIYLNGFHRIPLDLLLAAAAGLEFCGLLVLDQWFDRTDYFAVTAAVVLLMCGVLFGTFLSIVVRLKGGKWWKNTVIYRILRLLWRAICAVGRGIRAVCRAIPMLWKTILGIAGVTVFLVFLLVLANNGSDELSVVLFMLLYLALSTGVCLVTLQLIRLKDAGERLAQGDLGHQTETKGLFWEFRKHAEHLNSVAEGMSAAVEQRMKSERLKTELITNVSHDIKTPLTSIINYVDLLKKPHTEEQGREYLDVLDRQSQRLKKMTEDLVEASKASTGNISVHYEKTDAGELLRQAGSEYTDRFAARELQTVMKISNKPLSIMADGRLLWRVLENLLGNVCKYAQPRTRVYLEAEEKQGRIVMVVKNISAVMLDMDPEELLERFVRGDASRNTEGSGLGLSIARSLTELQGGTFRLEIDGDLFKAELSFPKYE